MRSLPEIKAKSPELGARDVCERRVPEEDLSSPFAVIISEVLAATGGSAVSNPGGSGGTSSQRNRKCNDSNDFK